MSNFFAIALQMVFTFFSCFDFQEGFLIGLEFSRKVRWAG